MASADHPEVAGLNILYIPDLLNKETSIVIIPEASNPPNSKLSVQSCFSFHRMSSFRQLLITFSLLALITLAFASAAPEGSSGSPSSEDELRFQEMLEGVSDASLHEVLHEYVTAKYKHGVYPADRAAMQVVHQDSPAMATSLVELARRQAGNSTASDTTGTGSGTSTVPNHGSTETPTTTPGESSSTSVGIPSSTAPPSTTPPVSSQVSSSSVPPVPVSSTSSSSLRPPTTNSSTSQTTSSAPPSTTSTTAPPTTSSTSTVAPSSSTSSIPKTSSTPTSKTTSTTVPASTSSSTSETSTQSSITQEILYTTTLENGARSTVTSYTIVLAGNQATTPVGNAPVTGTPSLQSNAANPRNVAAAKGILAGLIGIAAVL